MSQSINTLNGSYCLNLVFHFPLNALLRWTQLGWVVLKIENDTYIGVIVYTKLENFKEKITRYYI
jgi:hypothetical protein